MKRWLKISFWFQVVLLLSMMLGLIYNEILPLLLVIPFALWQFINGFILWLKKKAIGFAYVRFLQFYLFFCVIVFGVITFYQSAYLNSNRIGDFSGFVEGFIVTSSALLGIAFFIFSFLIQRNHKEIHHHFGEDVLDQNLNI